MFNKFIKLLFRLTLILVIAVITLIALVTQPVFVESRTKPAHADAKLLSQHVYTLSDNLYKNKREDLINARADYLYAQISQYSQNISVQEYLVDGEIYKNFVVNFNGDNNCGLYVVGAHYDTYDNLPGADDNTSATAGLIELTRIFSESPPACAMQLVFYSLEEPPHFRSQNMGSYVHAKSLHDSGKTVTLMLSLEMIGYFSDTQDSQYFPVPCMEYLYSNKGDFISLVGDTRQIGLIRFFKKEMIKATNLPVYSINAPTIIQGIDFSDQLNYWAFDYPAIMVTDTAFNRNKNYHTQYDTADKLDYERMAKVVDGVYYALKAHILKSK